MSTDVRALREDLRAEAVTLSLEETWEALNIGRTTAYRWVRDGTLPGVKLGGRWFVPLERLRRVLDGEAASPR